MSEPWAWEKDHGFDEDGHQRKEACLAITECPACGKEVELVGDTEAWTEDDDGRWVHAEYGPATGSCCDKLIVDSFEGCHVYSFSEGVSDEDCDEDDEDWYDDFDEDCDPCDSCDECGGY